MARSRMRVCVCVVLGLADSHTKSSGDKQTRSKTDPLTD